MPALWLHSEMQAGKGSGVGVPLWICLKIRMATPVHNDAFWCLFWTQIYDYFLDKYFFCYTCEEGPKNFLLLKP